MSSDTDNADTSEQDIAADDPTQGYQSPAIELQDEGAGWREWFGHFHLSDVVTRRAHSNDFSGSRADYISQRVRFVAALFAILTPLWIPLDFFVLESSAHSIQLTLLRVVTTALLAALAMLSRTTVSLSLARLRLILLLAIPLAFYFAARSILGDAVEHDAILAGYTLLPFVLVAVPAIFPLTLLEGFVLMGMVVGTVMAAAALVGELTSIATLSDLWLLALVGGIASVAEMSQLHALLRLYRQATVDPLTNLFNRRSLMRRLFGEVARAHRYKRPVAVIMLDLDRFKRVNDEYGHLAGDLILKNLAEIMVEEIRISDFVGRYGGEEFLAILPEASLEGAVAVAERIRTQCQASHVETSDGTKVYVTVSSGVTTLWNDDDTVGLFNRVDKLLYEAKHTGRNRVVSA